MSQVNFFMLESDETAFLEMIRSRSDTLFYPRDRSGSSNPEPLDGLPPFGRRESFTLVLSTIALPAEEAGASYTFGLYSHPIIDYTRCYLHNETLVSGRIYAKIGWLKKPESNRLYNSWYASLERWIKKRYLRVQQEWWVGPEAQAWSLKGGLLALGSPLSLKVNLSG